MKKMLIIVSIVLLSSPLMMKASGTSDIKVLWSNKDWSALGVHKLGILSMKTNTSNVITELAFLGINDGSDLWGSEINDIRKEIVGKNGNGYKEIVNFYMNCVIMSGWKGDKCFDLINGKKKWEQNTVELPWSIKNQKGPIIYTTLNKYYYTNTISLQTFDLVKGEIDKTFNVSLLSTPRLARNGSPAFVLSSSGPLVFIFFDYIIQCYDTVKEKVIWSIDVLGVYEDFFVMDDSIYYTRDEQIECETDINYIDCRNIETGDLKFRLNGDNLKIIGNKLYFFEKGCTNPGQQNKTLYLLKELPSLKTIKSIDLSKHYFPQISYGSKYICLYLLDHENPKKIPAVDVYDHDFNFVKRIDQLSQNMGIIALDDVFILSTSVKTSPEIIVYSLPNYNKSNHIYNPPFDLIKWIIKLIIGKLMGTP